MTAIGLVILSLAGSIYARTSNCNINMVVTRKDWGAKAPKEPVEYWPEPVPFVVIHHSYIPPACNKTKDCEKYVRSIQNTHQDVNKWNDIGYNFLIGGDGKIYEGRGYNITGAHSKGYNSKGLGICLIGDWRTELPSKEMIQAVHQIISTGVKKGYINSKYQIIGHRQVRATECPGDRLFKEMCTWKNANCSFENIIRDVK